jgi:glutathione synthase/RimK-type ligase-like ATP-grasp enzyme
MDRLCILTPDPDYEEHWQPVAARYQALLGLGAEQRTWNDPGDLSGFDLILPLMAWGYQRDPARWFHALDAWEAAGLKFANPIATLRWNTNKDYLFDLAEVGVAIVPSRLAHQLTRDDLTEARTEFGCEALVIKPTISGGADGTYRLGASDPIPFDVLEREMLIQPLMPMIASEGEFSLFYFEGRFSHAILKIPEAGDFRVQEQFGGREVSVDAPAAALTLADAALAAAPGPLTYARVDMVRGEDDGFYLMELELIEPSLFLDHASDGGAAFVAAVANLS